MRGSKDRGRERRHRFCHACLGKRCEFSLPVGSKCQGRAPYNSSGTLVDLLSHGEQTEGAWARVKKDGTFRLLDVPDGTFSFFMNGLEQGWYVKSVWSGRHRPLGKWIGSRKGKTGGTIEVVMVSNGGSELAGSVTQDDKPLVGRSAGSYYSRIQRLATIVCERAPRIPIRAATSLLLALLLVNTVL